jgi:flavin reductase (DIM6/NTAB) family NADH-FMN oxidoreductase RutF
MIHKEDILKMETRYRANFINSLGGFKSVILIGTKSKLGQENLAIFNSLFHLGANPALCGIICRPDVSERHTLENIIETGKYTINHITSDFVEKAHHTAARYPRTVSEFEAAELQPEYINDFFAPFVKESIIKFSVELREKHFLEINGTTLLIGEIMDVIIPEDVIDSTGFIDIEKAGTITCSGLDSYHLTKKIVQLPYAKPKL